MNFEVVPQTSIHSSQDWSEGMPKACSTNENIGDNKSPSIHPNAAPSRRNRKISKKSLLLASSKNTNTEWKTFLKVGQMSPTPRDITPFVIEWVPDLLPHMGIGEMTIKFEFGHQKNGQLDTFHQV